MPVLLREFQAGTAPNCRNKNCKSYGKPHPNCHCYDHTTGELAEHTPSFAKGGEVKSFCSSDQMHDKDCKYYAEGGTVDQDNEALMDQCALEMMHAIESKDKTAFLDSFHCLVADCMQKMSPEMDEGEK